MTREQAGELGRIQGDARLAVVEAGLGSDAALSYAAGMAASARDFVLRQCGATAAYELCAEMGDQTVDRAFKLTQEKPADGR